MGYSGVCLVVPEMLWVYGVWYYRWMVLISARHCVGPLRTDAGPHSVLPHGKAIYIC